MRTETKPVHYCEHCNKYGVHSGHILRHEKWCKNNPANKHKCLMYCKHLVKGTEQYDIHEHVDGLGEVPFACNRTVFTCGLSGQKMYSFKAEKLDIVKHLEDNIRMPLECGLYAPMPGHESYCLNEDDAKIHQEANQKEMDENLLDQLPY